MSAFWHPLSAIYMQDPRALASPSVVRMLLASEGAADLLYAGDRMWPALRHGQAIRVVPRGAPPAPGDVVLAASGGILDVVRVQPRGEEMDASYDADPAAPRPLREDEVLGRVDAAPRRIPVPPAWRRALLDIVEAAAHGPDRDDEPETSVRAKYDEQAPHYARMETDPLEPALREAVRRAFAPGAAVLVAGSGTGREALALEAMGFAVRGIDFSPRMVAAAAQEASRRGARASFQVADLRAHDEPAGSLGGIFFTYDVYSFIAGRRERVDVLRRMARWLTPDGALLLSARRWTRAREAATLAIQVLAHPRVRPAAEWGDSHTRWLDGTGAMRRSFVHLASDRRLDEEAAAAGFRRVDWQGGHGWYR